MNDSAGMPDNEGLNRYLDERRREREVAARPRLFEVDQTEFVDETAANVITILGSLAGKPVELEIAEFTDQAAPRLLRHRGDLFRLEEALGGWLIWVSERWLPLAPGQIVCRGSIRYRFGSETWWAWCLTWLDWTMDWKLTLIDRRLTPAELDQWNVYLVDAEIQA